MNTLEERADDFVPVNYGELIDLISATITSPGTRVFRPAGEGKRYLQIEADQLAQLVAERSGRLKSPLGASGSEARVATTHFGDTYPAFVQKVRQLGEHIAAALEGATTAPSTVPELVASLCTPLSDLTSQGVRFGLHYPFDTPYTGLKKLRLSLRPQAGRRPSLRLHRVAVTIDHPDQFTIHLEAALRRHAEELIDQGQGDALDRDDLEAVITQQLEDKGSDFWRLCKLINTESLGKIRREVQVRYLEFLRDSLGEGKGATLLRDLIRRLRLIETYLAEHAPDDAHYEVSYAESRALNYRDLFARSDAFDPLPIIPLLDGKLGETTDAGGSYRTYLSGVKLKLGGQVHTAGSQAPEVFDYHLDEYLNPEGESHQARRQDGRRGEDFKGRVLRVALLYFFALRKLGDLTYDPIEPFEKGILPALQGEDEAARRKVLGQIRAVLLNDKDSEGRTLQARIADLRTWLRDSLQRRSDFSPQRYPFHLLVKRGLLEQSLDAVLTRRTLFRPVFGDDSKDALRYVTVGEAHVDSTALCKLTGVLAIDNTHFYPTDDEQQFSMRYAVDGLTALPVFIGPKPNARSVRGAFTTYFGDYRQVLLPYDAEYLDKQAAAHQPVAAFCYRFTFALIAYLSLSTIAAQAPGPLFLPLLRFHLDSELQPTEQGTFIRNLSKILVHLFGETYRANTQGFDVRPLTTLASSAKTTGSIDIPKTFQYKVANGLSSLYGVLPKRFTFAEPAPNLLLDRMAIVIVSSRESDSKRGPTRRKANLMGEIVTIARQPDGMVELATRQTFSDVYRQEQMHSEPTVLIDAVGRMYEEGYRHFVYIARSPYSSTLHLTSLEDDDDLFFMSRKVISSLKSGRPDLKLYPVFYDMYPVVRMQGVKPQSLYIQDTLELTQLMEDASRRTVMFFNLFNGKVVASKDDLESRFYHQVIAYSTLLNMYDGVLDDRDIYVGLLNDAAAPSLKDALLTYLTLFHFARYEGAARGGSIELKLDPYQHLIGDDSVGRLSMMRHMTGGAEFNLMAFLTEVRKVVGGVVAASA